MLAAGARWAPTQILGRQVEVLGEVLRDEVNLALWQRSLAAPVSAFAEHVLAKGEPLAQSMMIELASGEAPLGLANLVEHCAAIPGQADFLADVSWLVSAFAYLLDAKRIGLRLRLLDKAMCPRFHVDQVPLRLITSYAGVGSQWLREGVMARRQLGDPAAEPQDIGLIERSAAGHVLLAKGEKWLGNEGAGLIHRSPPLPSGQRRLLLTLDWLA